MSKRIGINNSLKLKCPLTGKACSGTQNKRRQIKTAIKYHFTSMRLAKIRHALLGK